MIGQSQIISINEINGWTIIEFKYKIFVYDKPAEKVLSFNFPFAEFVPTEEGARMAEFICENKG